MSELTREKRSGCFSNHCLMLLLLLLSHFSWVRLCDPIDSSPPGSPVPGILQGKNTGVGCHFLLQCMKVESESEVAQSCLTLRNPMDCSLQASSVHGIFQARVLEWGAIAFSTLSHDLIINILGNEKLKLPALPWKFSYKYFLIIGTRYL